MKSKLDRRTFLTGAATAALAGVALSGTALAAEDAAAPAQPAPPAYQPPALERALTGPLLVDLEAEAEKILEPGVFAFIAKGAEKGWTLRENTRAFDDFQLLPRYLSAQKEPDLETTLLGHKLSLPVITTPMGAQGLAHASAEVGMAFGSAEAGTIMTLSTASNTSIEDVAKAGVGPKWFQIYLLENDRPGSRALLDRAKAAGYSAIVFTIDAFAPGSSDAVERLGFSFPPGLAMVNSAGAAFKKSLGWDDVAFLRESTDLPIILKGLISPGIVERALTMGVAGFQVSNHGGRQLDGVPPAIKMLPAIVKEVGGAAPVILDSGIRRGSDVFKALALGADAVALGRPLYYGLALGGAEGVASVYARLKAELARTMLISGLASVKEITRGFVA
ncbi:alpha-hydroxy-acid oxidizing protein [Desulfovibrio sp. OttesenSCG-928-C14]|nr:alpha-hydroxy-acid oxidizing protein [Desulfovibrio sp. OttesenSCG-928-C14]